MAEKEKFTPEEWFSILSAPASAGTFVMASSPSGLTGLLAETQSIVQGLRDFSAASSSGFLQEIAESLKPGSEALPAQPRETFKTVDEAKERMLNKVRQAVFLVDSKVNADDAKAFKAMVMNVAQRAAEAATEGGFLGIGGTRVSKAEEEALSVLREYLEPSSTTISSGTGL
jgi:hypothetical protein